ncbi:MAG: hypothetical protein DRI44_03975 [Chlamydiae bacterium]|nr:MAG: hypothetical protein DRI44_03975 [Chlamydiota bacterium]
MKKVLFTFLILFSCFSSTYANTVAKVEDYNGSPTLFINGKPTVPMMFYGYAEDLTSDPNCKFVQQAKYMTNANMHIYTFPISFNIMFDKNYTWWYVLDDVVNAVTNFDCNAMVIPRIYLYPKQWYIDENPDIKMEFSDGLTDRICLASEKWRNYIKGKLREFVQHCESKFGNNVIGYHLTLMETGEWFYERSWDNVFSGYSENMRLGFSNWAQNKYGTETALRNAWNDGSVTFSTITLPITSERSNSASDFFRNPTTEMKTIDFYQYKNELVPETIDLMAAEVKSVTSGNKLVATFYGYTFELTAVPKGPAVTGHLALKKLLQSPNIDIIAGPTSYVNRRGGGIDAFMSPVDSIRKAGKMWFNENDNKTYLDTSSDYEIDGNYPTLALTQNAHANNFAHILCRRMGTWYMDLHNRGWLNSSEIWQNISKLHSIYKGQLGEKSPWNPEVAVIVDERSPYYLACNDDFLEPLCYSLRTRLYRMGVPFNIYLLSDVLDGTVTLPKVNIFLGANYLTTSERSTLHSALSGKAAIWFHGAGYFNENGAATENIEDLTGFDMTQFNNVSARINVVSASSANPWNNGIGGTSFKPSIVDRGNSSIYETKDQNITYDIYWGVAGPGNAVQIGTYYGKVYTGLAVMDYLGFKSFYCGIAGIPTKFLRNVCKNMGVHVYVDDDYVIDSDSEFLSVYSPKNETQSIVLSNNFYLTDMNTGGLDPTVGGVFNQSFSVGSIKTSWIGKNSIGGFADKTINKGLWHCDNSYVPGGYWVASDDDHSSGRSYTWPLLNYKRLHTHASAPSLIPNSPKGGNCFKFDGKNDNITAVSGWVNDSNSFSGNVSLKWTDLPSLNDNYAAILVSRPWKLYLKNNGWGKGNLLFRVLNSAGTAYTDVQSSVDLHSNKWYDVNFKVYDNIASITINNQTDAVELNNGMSTSSSDVYAGSDLNSTHYFKGEMDEIMFGAAISGPTNAPPPQPVTHTIAYWRFEEGTAGVAHSGTNDNWYLDYSSNSYNLSAWGDEVNPRATGDVPFSTVPLTGEDNNLALRMTGSHSSGQNISTAPSAPINYYDFSGGFTIECMVKYNNDEFAVVVGKDGRPGSDGNQPFCIKHRASNPEGLEFDFTDGGGTRHRLRSADSGLYPETGVWYHIAAVCDGTNAYLYWQTGGNSYQLIASDNTVSGGALWHNNNKWTVGRGMWADNPSDYLNGYVDEVRISDEALPHELFLGFIPEPSLILSGFIFLFLGLIRKLQN